MLATLFTENWKRYGASLAYGWGTSNFEEEVKKPHTMSDKTRKPREQNLSEKSVKACTGTMNGFLGTL